FSVMPLIFGLFIVLAIVLVVIGAVQARRRQEALEAFAQRHGLRLDTSRVRGIDTQYPDFKCFTRGSNRYATNRLEGSWRGRGFRSFDYHYETSSTDSKGKRRTTSHWFTAVVLTSDVPLKPL